MHKRKFRRDHAPYLAPIRLYWCDQCNVPRIANTSCSVCGSTPRTVALSPPGDPFPVLAGHREVAAATVDRQFGSGVSTLLLPPDRPILMNKVPAADAMYEVIVDGHIVGRLRFELPELEYVFVLTIEGGRRISLCSQSKWVRCDDSVIPFIERGASLLVPGVSSCDPSIQVGDEVWLSDSHGLVFGVGTAKMTGEQMRQATRGLAVKVRESASPTPPHINTKSASWTDVVAANARDLAQIEQEAVTFIRDVIEQKKLSAVVGFSGGKDSLVTYLLVEKAMGRSPPLFFINTGLELPETVDYVYRFARDRGIDIIGENMGDRFWESIPSFGPPARDFRWCCKVLKLGPAATAIARFSDGPILTFMGQRRLESFQRSIEPRVTSNVWVPGQLAANPIQAWNALEVWLYIFQQGVDFNPLYTRGHHRMGCYLCPASSLSDLRSLRESHPELHSRWIKTLYAWAQKHGFPQAWADLGFWRWKNLPPGPAKLASELGIVFSTSRMSAPQSLELRISKGVSPCTLSGFSVEGQFSCGIDLSRVSQLLSIFGQTQMSEELGALRIRAKEYSIMLFSSGSVIFRGPNSKSLETLVRQFERAVRRALFCQACGSCIPHCRHNALLIAHDGKISVDPSRCVNCRECDSWPCPTYLR